MYKVNLEQIFTKNILDIVYSALPQVFGVLTSIITSVLIARNLGASELGLYSMTLSLVTILGTIIDLGISQTAIRYASRANHVGLMGQQNYIIRWSFYFRLIFLISFSTLIYLFISPISISFFHSGNKDYLIWYSVLITFLNLMTTTPNLFLQSDKKFRISALLGIISKSVIFIFIIILYFLNKWTIELLLSSLIISNIITLLISFFFVPINIFYNRINTINSFFKEIKGLFKLNLLAKGINVSTEESTISFFKSYSIITLVSIFTNQVDIWAVNHYFSLRDVGLYSVGQRYALPINVLFMSITTVMWPHMSNYTSKAEIIQFYQRNKVKILILIFFVLLYSFIAPLTAGYFFGDEYIKAIPIGIMLSIKGLISIFTGMSAILLYNLNKTKKSLYFNVIQALTLFLLVVYFVKHYGAFAASIAVAISEFVLFSLTLIALIINLKCK
jgi:O-antigen/teichoic acid export membrane protein